MFYHPLKIQDVDWLVNRLPRAVRSVMESKEFAGRIFVAGGFVRAWLGHETVSDVDLFVTQDVSVKGLADRIGEETAPHPAAGVVETENAITVAGRLPVQVITAWRFGSLENVLASFDFAACAAGIEFAREGKYWHGLCCADFYSDLATKRLTYLRPHRGDRPEDAGASMLRMLKLVGRGYRISLENLAVLLGELFDVTESRRTRATGDRRSALVALLWEIDPLPALLAEGMDRR